MQTPLRKKFGAVLLAAALFIGLCPLPGRAAATPGGARVADADTRNSYMENLGGADSTLLDGRIWSDKSLSTESLTFTGDAGSITVENDADFLVTYSALATSTQLIQETTAPVDIVFILDFSASMAWGQYENGAGAVTDQAGSRVQAMVDAVNNAIGALVAADPRSRVGIVCFNRGAQTMLELTAVTPRPDGDYLEITRWNATPGADDGNRGNVQVTCNINSAALPLSKPDAAARTRETAAPTSIPAQAPVRFIRFHHSPRKYGARKAPEIVPQEKDISVRMGVLNTAIRNDSMINTRQSSLV